MKEYILLFRDSVSKGAFRLSKRLIVPYLVLFIVLSIIGAVVLIPLMLQALGFSFTELLTFQQNMSQDLKSGSDPKEVFGAMFGGLNFGFLMLTILVAILFYAWFMNVLVTANDNEIRMNNNGFVSALGRSFNGNIVQIVFHIVVYSLFQLAVMLIFGFIVSILMSASKALGILVGFVGFFFVAMFILRFILVVPAIVHGKMSMASAWAYSFKNITWKRSGIILLLILLAVVILVIIMLILMSVFMGAAIDSSGEFSAGQMIINQIVSMIINAFVVALGTSFLSALYFRYSADEVSDETDHLITEELH